MNGKLSGRWWRCALAACVLIAGTGLVEGSVIYVKPNGSGNGSSWNDAYGGLQVAINNASAGDEIWVAYHQTGGYSPGASSSDTFTLKPGVAIYGGFAGSENDKADRLSANRSTLDGTSVNNTVVTAIPGIGQNGAYVLDQIKIANGKNTGTTRAAGLHAETNQVILNNCTFENNEAGYYGAVYIKVPSTPATVTGCLFEDNIANTDNTDQTGVRDSEGGALYLEGDAEVLLCQFKNNWALHGIGGGLRAKGGDVEVKNSLFFGSNKAQCTGGGAIYAGDGVDMVVRNCTIWDNYSIDNVADSQACAKGAGLYAVGSTTTVDIDSTIFWDNQVQLESGQYVDSDIETDSSPTVNVDYTCIKTGWGSGTGNITSDPWPGSTGFRIQAGSPCEDAGDPNTALDWNTDIDGSLRVVNGQVDMGVNELQQGLCCLGDGTCKTSVETECTKYVCDVTAINGATCYADVDGSGVVNASDRAFISANVGQTEYEKICLYDLDASGVINVSDRGFVSANIGLCTTLPDWQDNSGTKYGNPDPRFATPVWSEGLSCEIDADLCQ